MGINGLKSVNICVEELIMQLKIIGNELNFFKIIFKEFNNQKKA